MKNPKLNLSIGGYTDSDFQGKSKYVLSSLTGNPAFPQTVPPLADLSTAINAYGSALVGAASGTHAMVAAKNERRAELEAIYTQLGMYVMYVANGNLEILVSSGYTVAKDREPVYISNPGNVTLINGVTSGELESIVGAVKGSKLYLHQISETEPTENTVWDTRTCSRCKYTFKGLVPGKKYWVRVAATASGDQIAYSTIASQYVI
jgi:hypothetical protein